MKTILCYGDSNTWGYIPGSGGARFSRDERWPGVLQHELEEGLNGRTTIFDDPITEHRNGKNYLAPCLESHAPLDLVTIMLGINDLKQRIGRSADDIAEGAGVLATMVQRSGAGPGGSAPRVLLMLPNMLGKLTDFAERFEGGGAKSKRLAGLYRAVATSCGCAFLDTTAVVRTSDVDGVHLEAGEHVTLGQAVAVAVRHILS